MTEAPAQRREQPGPLSPGPGGTGEASTGEASTGVASTGEAGAGPAATPASPGILPAGSRWGRVRWLFAAIWLVYLAQPIGKLWSDLEPGPPVPGTGRPDRVRGLVHRDVRRRPISADLPEPADLPPDRRGRAGRRERAGGAGVCGARPASRQPADLRGRDGGIPAAHPGGLGRGERCCVGKVSLIVPWQANGWTRSTALTMAFQIFVSALAAWGVSHVIQRNAQLVEARNEITRLALAEQRNQFSRDMHDILGHSLTVVAVKAELAGRLTSLDPERARDRDRGRGTDRPVVGRWPMSGPPRPGTVVGHPGRGAGWQCPDRAGGRRHRGGPAR